MKARGIIHEITAEIKLPDGNAFWATYRAPGLRKLDILARLEAEGNRVISIRHTKYYAWDKV